MTTQPEPTTLPDPNQPNPPSSADPLTLVALIQATEDALTAGADGSRRYAEALVALLADQGLVIVPDQNVIVERYTDSAGEHRWRALDRHNRQVIADSAEGYVSATHCAHMAERLFPTATSQET